MSDTFKSRYGQTRTITKQADGSFLLHGESRYYRCGAKENEDGISMVDFEGGPFICVGDPLFGSKKNYGIIKEIVIPKEQTENHFTVKIICE